jgi:hypothetical protein
LSAPKDYPNFFSFFSGRHPASISQNFKQTLNSSLADAACAMSCKAGVSYRKQTRRVAKDTWSFGGAPPDHKIIITRSFVNGYEEITVVLL